MQKAVENNVRWVKNKFYSSDYNLAELRFFQEKEVEKIHSFQKTHRLFTTTPLYHLKQLAEYLNVADIRIKDESHRFALNAFKVLGSIYAMAKFIANRIGEDVESLSFDILQSEDIKKRLGELTFISATDGNHGRGVAWAARELGHQSVILLPKGSSLERLNAIRNEGAKAKITDLNYDHTVRMCAKLANENGWILVQDTAWQGYEEIPLWIMQGYATIARETAMQLKESNAEPPTHVFLQAGVGSFPAAIAACMIEYFHERPPHIVIVEPNQADCFYRSFSNDEGKREIVEGEMNTIMAGLACGEPNTIAYHILRQYAIGSISCDDSIAALGMRMYGNPLKNDPRIIAGESGAVSLGLLHSLRMDQKVENICYELGLNANSRVLLINTEGDTDPAFYRKIVWEGAYPK
ncbi:diaminopropionate ammonia-lyase [Bacillus sp. Bva_UNVM-123]|uniref:diaminopropionate ammonia-lyase n=1 Tax=Bacillus sp. Bva_UNVM-123 TaxID=2829798 RepID=UPI00391F8651